MIFVKVSTVELLEIRSNDQMVANGDNDGAVLGANEGIVLGAVLGVWLGSLLGDNDGVAALLVGVTFGHRHLDTLLLHHRLGLPHGGVAADLLGVLLK